LIGQTAKSWSGIEESAVMSSQNGIGKYFRTARPATPEEIAPILWNEAVGAEAYRPEQERYQAAILEQYKLCVEMADRVSARRSLTNTFFLTLNGAAFTLIGVFWRDRPEGEPMLLAVPLVPLLALCLAWFWLVRSYRQLNSGKFAVIGALEERLPASPYWRGEWHALGKGEDKGRYWPFTHLEVWIPALFGFTYLAGFVAAVLT
jgi:hypothetical protein